MIRFSIKDIFSCSIMQFIKMTIVLRDLFHKFTQITKKNLTKSKECI